MSGRLAILLAIGASLGVVGAYLIAGGASYTPLAAADPCEPRSEQVLEERQVFEGIVLSALDGAACELRVSREDLVAALATEETLAEFAEEHKVSEQDVDGAVRAGLTRAVDDAERQGRLSPAAATAARFLADRLPVSTVLDVFRALPGDPTLVDVLAALQEAGIQVEEVRELISEIAEELGLPELPDDLDQLLPGDAPSDLRDLLPDELQGAVP